MVKRKSPQPAGVVSRSESGHRNGRVTGPHLDPSTTQAIFRPLKAAESVARDIAHDIIDQGLSTGDPLPNEASMIEQYRVSRESLREGLRLLETQGLITIRRGPGGGPLVGSVDPANLGRVSSLYFHMAGATYAELFDAWLMAETLIAEQAARNPDAGKRRQLMEPYLGDHAHGEPAEVGEFFAMHAAFHVKIGMLMENRVLELSLRSFGTIVSHHTLRVDDPRRLGDVLVDDHRVIAKAVAAGHATKARTEMQRHIENVIEDIRAHMGDKVHDYVEWL
jgi:GntR family transcriptional regulator, transcriptional repressor for pyruvate dehydrogenase complex